MPQYESGNNTFNRNGNTIRSIMDISFNNNLWIYVFPGNISPNDIWIKYKDGNSTNRIRTPKHIHWVLDVLIKKGKNPKLVDQFLEDMHTRWKNIRGLQNRNYKAILTNLQLSRNTRFINRFNQLNGIGFWNMAFITHLMELLMLQEKTNNPNAYMFGNVVNSILNSHDPYVIVSKTTMRRR
jgi:predicted metalloprotease with PDZ domain